MPDTHIRFALSLALLHGVGRRRLGTLLARGEGDRIASARDLAAFFVHRAADMKLRLDDAAFERAWRDSEELAAACRRRHWHVWVKGGPEYPTRLLRLDDPPSVLFVEGRHQPDDRPRIAVIGTREPSRWGTATAAACASAVVASGGMVVAGLAWGIDTAAHTAVVELGGCTWAVLPSGLDLVFPPSNARLSERIVAAGGALVTEYLPGTRPHHTFFVERDRLQAALSDAVVVVETGLSGGTMHTVRFARALDVPVYVTLPADLDAAIVRRADDLPEQQRGPWSLLRDGARRIEPPQIAGLVAGRGRLPRADDPGPGRGSTRTRPGG
jgi:DNA processing protein